MFYNLLEITMFEWFFLFDGTFYKQCDGVAIVSPIEISLYKVFKYSEIILLISINKQTKNLFQKLQFQKKQICDMSFP